MAHLIAGSRSPIRVVVIASVLWLASVPALAQSVAIVTDLSGKVSGPDPVTILSEIAADAQEFARMAQRRLATAESSRSRGVKQAPFVVLMGVHSPAVLVEVGFLTNANEESRLASRTERERLVFGLAEAVAAFRVRQDARLGVAENGGGKR